MPMPSRFAFIGRRLALLLASTLATVVAVECGLRVQAHLCNQGLLSTALAATVDPPHSGAASLGHIIRPSSNRRIIYELKPGLDVRFRGARATTSSAGFRCAEHPFDKSPGTFRIVGLGDSFMFGHGVADHETYMDLLEQWLNRCSNGPAVEIINTAVPGYNTVMEVETLRERGLAYKPDLVLIHFVGNDLDLPNFIRVPVQVLSVKNSFLGDLVAESANHRQPRLHRRLERIGLVVAPRDETRPRSFANVPDKVPPAYRDMVSWEAFERAMLDLRSLQLEHGFEVAWTTFSANPAPLHRRARGLAQTLGFHDMDVGGAFKRYLEEHGHASYLQSPLAISPRNGHPNALGHRLAAEAMFEVLCEQYLSLSIRDGCGPPAPVTGVEM